VQLTTRKIPKENTCDTCTESQHPDHSGELPRLRRALGQLGSVERMVLGRRYCPDILHQIRAVNAALVTLETLILKRHMYHCVTSAMGSKNPKNISTKIEELIELMERSLK